MMQFWVAARVRLLRPLSISLSEYSNRLYDTCLSATMTDSKIPSPSADGRLFSELYEAIINYIDSDDIPALRACSMTCKTFLLSSRPRLFYRINICRKDDADRFIEIICSAPPPTNPSSHVRYLHIEEGLARYDFEPRWASMALPILTAALLEVTVLEIYNLNWRVLDDKARTSLMSGFQKVEALQLLYAEFETVGLMDKLVSTFPSLTELDISQCYWSSETPTIPLPTTLQVLSLQASDSNHFGQLFSMAQHPRLRTIKFSDIEEDDVPDIGRLLNIIGSSLEHLDLDALGSIPGAQGSPLYLSDYLDLTCIIFATAVINLAGCVNLRSIEVNFGRVDQSGGSFNMDGLSTLFSQIISPNVVEIFVVIQVQVILDLDLIDWARLERTLINLKWAANLQKMQLLLFCNPHLIPAAAEFLRAHLPVLAAERGIVWVRSGSRSEVEIKC